MDRKLKLGMEAYTMMYAPKETVEEETEQVDEVVGLALRGAAALGGMWAAGKAMEAGKKKADDAINKARQTSPIGGDRRVPQMNSYEPEGEEVDEDAKYDRNRQRAAQRAAARNQARREGKTGNVPGVGYVSPRAERETYRDSAGVERHTSGAKMPQKEDVDIFDTILNYLISEGYADTNENALVIMSNMSEEWRESILDEEQLDELSHDTYRSVAKKQSEKVGALQDAGKDDTEAQNRLDRTKRLRKKSFVGPKAPGARNPYMK